MLGPYHHCEPFYIAIHQVSPLSHATCASMSTTTMTTTMTMRDRGDRYGPREWAQLKMTTLALGACLLGLCIGLPLLFII